MNEITIKIMTYVLELEGAHFYIGKSFNLNFRMAQHFSGFGSRWTKLHKPIKIVECCIGDHEKDLTLKYMREKGWKKVRGGGWCKVDMKYPPHELNLVK